MAPDLLTTICAEIAERMDGLRPLLDEHEQLLAAAAALEATPPEGSDGASTNRKRQRPHRDARVKTSAVVAAPGGRGASKGESTKTPKLARRRSPAKPPRAVRGAAREAILGALEHGSHTVSELSVVTAMTGPNINGNLRRLAAEGVVVKTAREGKAAWALT
ncbi:MAG TPA: hypothetical protein VGI26_07940 [Solirubrobacteraceae bacterium]|jgi:hypothetical protein